MTFFIEIYSILRSLIVTFNSLIVSRRDIMRIAPNVKVLTYGCYPLPNEKKYLRVPDELGVVSEHCVEFRHISTITNTTIIVKISPQARKERTDIVAAPKVHR